MRPTALRLGHRRVLGRARHRRVFRGPEQREFYAQAIAAKMAAKRQPDPIYTDHARTIDAPYRAPDGRAVWYPIEVYPVGSDIESTVQVSGRTPERLRRFVDGHDRGSAGAGMICLKHTDPYRRKIWCRNEAQANIEMARHGVEDGRDFGEDLAG